MSLERFAPSRPLTMGVELELQVVNRHDYDLAPSVEDLLRVMKGVDIPGEVKPEITDCMLELSTGICNSYQELIDQLELIRGELLRAADKLNLGLCGGGTHPFQQWTQRQIFETPRYQHLSELYGYLSKQFTVFGQHVHIGCPGPDEALCMLHALSRYIPHFIALSASSPYVQGVDTGFDSARINSVAAFPLSGWAPFLLNWDDFTRYFEHMTRTGVVESMKDFYWDIRPKPEYGTIEVRVMDTPLSLEKAARIAAYIQAIVRRQLVEKPDRPLEDDYLVYSFNRFQACRFGFDGAFVDPRTLEHRTIRDDILLTLDTLEPHAIELGGDGACRELRLDVLNRGNDAGWIRALQRQENLLPEVVRQQCLRWSQ